MDYKKAFYILEITHNDFSYEYLKKQYHKLSLKHHPDKNGNTYESTERFKEINEAYFYLKTELKYLDVNDMDTNLSTNTNTNTNADTSLYADVLRLFMQNIMAGKYNVIISNIVNEIVTGAKQITVKLFEDLDKETALNIYTFLSKQQSVLHLNKIDLEKVKEIVLQKYENVHLYKLNPSLNDLFNNNVYKLYVDAKLYIVPLWHNELYFDGSGCEIIVICEPDLPKNIKIDEDNNIYVEIKLSAYQELCAKIINQSSIEVDVGNNVFNIPISELYMKKEQYYKIKGKGISKIKNDIYDITEKADIIVKMVIF